MSVIQRIRDKGAWIIFGIIALALIAFILQDGVRRGGSTFSNTTTIGVINGEKIERADFEEKLALQEKMYASQGAQREQLIGSLWSSEIDRVVLNQEYEKLGMQVPPKELSDILFGNNSPLKQEFTNPTTGEFDANQARTQIAQLKKSKNADQIKSVNAIYITPAIEQTLRRKYQTLLVQSAYIPKWYAEKQMADNNAITSFSYVSVPYLSVSDSTFPVSDDDVTAYVKKHSKEFQKTEETRKISYITFNAAPSKSDSDNAKNQVLALKNDFATATDVEAFLTKAGTELPFYNSYFSKNRIQQVYKDSLTRLPTGGLFGPYVDGANYVLAKMVGSKVWPDSAKVRHILVSTAPDRNGNPGRPDSVAKKLIDSIELAIKTGANFDALCARYSDDGNRDKGGVYDYFPQGQMVVPFNDFAFDKPVGSKGVVKTDFGYHYIEVLGQKNPATAFKIAYLAKPIISSNETVGAANTAASQFAVSVKDPKQYNENAGKLGKQIFTSTDIKQNDFSINGIGQSRQLIRWIFEHSNGDVSDPTEVGDQFVVAIVSAINKAGTMSAAEARPTVEAIIRNEKKGKQIIETRFKGNTLEAYASSTGAPILKADSLSFSAPFISGVGSEPKIIGAAFNKTLAGKTSEPIAGLTGVFAIKIESNAAKQASQDMASFKQTLLQGARSAAFRGQDALRKAATIKDTRSKFY